MYNITQGKFYRRAGRDYREFIFFLFLIFSVFIKFYFMEMSISLSPARHPASMAASFGITLMLIVPVSLLWRRIRCFTALLIDLLLTSLVITDLLYMRYYSDLFTFANLGLGAQVGEIAESVFALFSIADILYFADIPILILYVFMSGKFTVKPFFKKVTFRRALLSFILIAAGALSLMWRVTSYQKMVPGVLRSMWDRPAVCSNIGSMTYHIVDAWNVTHSNVSRDGINKYEIDLMTAWFRHRDNSVNLNSGKFYGAARGKNLIIIQAESLQQFVIGLKVGGAEVTPNLNRFAKESIYFSNVYNQTGTGNSSDAEFLVNAGLYPSASGVAYTRFAGNTYMALPKLLADNGYSTLALHGDRPGFWNRQHMYPSLGFRRFVSRKDFSDDEIIGMGLSDKSFFSQSLGILAAEQRPFYAFLITLTSHYPYNFDPIARQTKLNTGDFKGTLMGDYLTSMRYLDNQFGMFINGLKKNGLMKDSVVMVYGDHTAIPAWDKASLEKLLRRSLQEDWAWRSISKIPLIINIPGVKAAAYEDKSSRGIIDASATAAYLLGFRLDMGLGHNLFDEHNEPVIFRNGSFIYKNVFVEPSKKSAVDVRNGRKKSYGSYGHIAEKVEKILGLSDKILEHDLVPKLTKDE